MKNRLKQEIFVVLGSAILFFLVSYPFTWINSYFVITEVRISAVLNPCLGFVFGPGGAIGCALGNFVCDCLSVDLDIALRGFAFQLVYGLIPWLLLRAFPMSKEQKAYYRFTGVKSVLYFYLAVVAACLFVAAALAIFFAEGSTRGELFRFILSNNIAANFIFAIPFVLLLVRLKRRMNRLPKIEKVGIGETFLLFFVLVECATILLVCFISYFLLRNYQQDVEMWDNVFYSAVFTALFFAVLQIAFVEVIEKKILRPLNALAGVWQKDRKLAIEMCNALYHNKSEIGDLSRAYLELVDEIQINVMKLSTSKTRNNGVSDVVVSGDIAEMSFSGSLEETEAKDLAINLAQIPKACTFLVIDTEAMTFMTGESLRKLSEFIEKRRGMRVVMRHVSESTRTILNITGFIDVIDIG